MTRIYSILTFLFLCFLSFGQLKFSTTKYDFGDLEPYSARYVDIALENIGQKEEWILRVQKTMEVTYITSKQIIPVDSTQLFDFTSTRERKVVSATMLRFTRAIKTRQRR